MFVSSSFEMPKKFVKQTYYLNAICEQQTAPAISIKSHGQNTWSFENMAATL